MTTWTEALKIYIQQREKIETDLYEAKNAWTTAQETHVAERNRILKEFKYDK